MKLIQNKNAMYIDNSIISEKKLNATEILISSFKHGIQGFFIVFTLIIFAKFLAVSVNSIKDFSLGINDFILCFWAFMILSFIAFAGRYKRIKKQASSNSY
jgi:uncharacterized membrane protein YjjP (DUF1212 family)